MPASEARKETESMRTMIDQRTFVKAIAFGARGCSSCTCDPCDCNPCNCGDSLEPGYPRWRVSGYQVSETAAENAHLAGQIIIAVSQPVDEGDCSHWQEVILVDEAAAESQVGDLLERFEAHLDSMPAEVEHRRSSRRAVYRASIAYQEPLLSVSFSPDQAMLLREGGDSSQSPRAWAYTGPVATRGHFL